MFQYIVKFFYEAFVIENCLHGVLFLLQKVKDIQKHSVCETSLFDAVFKAVVKQNKSYSCFEYLV